MAGNIENFGTIGAPRPSGYEGLADALATGMKIAASKQTAQEKVLASEQIATLRAQTSLYNTQTRALSTADKTNEDDQTKIIIQGNKSASAEEIATILNNNRMAAAQIATPGANQDNNAIVNAANQKNLDAIKLKKQHDDQMFQNAQKLHEQHTMATEYMSPDALAAHKSIGHHDEITKVIAKGYGVSPKDVPRLNPVSIHANQIKQTIASIPGQIKQNGKITPQTKQVYQEVRKYGVEDTALAAHLVALDKSVDHANPQAVHEAINAKAQMIKQARSGSNGGNFVDGVSQPTDNDLQQALQGN